MTDKTNMNPELAQIINERDSYKARLIQIESSKSWRIIQKLLRIYHKLFPENSFQKRALRKAIRLFRSTILLFKKLVVKLKNILLNFFIKLKNTIERKPRNINLASKKLVYIGHSYHNKTKSTVFLIDYLKEFFDVEVVLDESWQEGFAYPDLSFIDESYVGVVFFQSTPPSDVLDKIKNDNLIFFPMFDAYGLHDYTFWKNFKRFKIINFSSTLHKKLLGWGLQSIAVQYFPKPAEFSPGDPSSVYFWQRLSWISINTLEALFQNQSPKIHIHKAIDPGQIFIEPSKLQEEKYSISYSTWFDTREEMLELIKSKGIFIAPREYEGIGMSFLEAMSMGKAVIAIDHPTMNEYVMHNKTGYLFDLSNLKSLDLSNVHEIQKNTYEYMQEGYKIWESQKKEIINFILAK